MMIGNKYKPIKQAHVESGFSEAKTFFKDQIRVATKRWRRSSRYNSIDFSQWGRPWYEYLLEEDLNAYEDRARSIWTGRFDPYFY
jgi:hypothetical protein